MVWVDRPILLRVVHSNLLLLVKKILKVSDVALNLSRQVATDGSLYFLQLLADSLFKSFLALTVDKILQSTRREKQSNYKIDLDLIFVR